MNAKFVRNSVVLGLLTAVGPISVDMYLPALPGIAEDLSASQSAVQWTLAAFFLSMGLAQLLYGPASDIFGRKAPIQFGLVLFIIGSVGCFLATDAASLIGFRILQGFGAAAPMVIARAVVRDLHSGLEATRMMSMMMLVFSICPLAAPLVGSAIMSQFGWRAVFVTVGVIAAFSLLLATSVLPETRAPGAQGRSGLATVLRDCRMCLRDKAFVGTVLIGGFGLATFYVFVAASPFVYIGHYGLTPVQYSLAFSVNAVAWVISAQFAAVIGSRIGLARMVKISSYLFAASMLVLSAVLAVTTMAGASDFLVLAVGLFIGNAFLGLVIPTSMVLALEDHAEVSGTASALAGTIQMLVGGTIAALGTAMFSGQPLPMVATIAVCGVASSVFCFTTLSLDDEAIEAVLTS
jgi:DHA1 family bicyclomycin/chloramphenicol resistance-like MFS transporter